MPDRRKQVLQFCSFWSSEMILTPGYIGITEKEIEATIVYWCSSVDNGK